MWELIARFVLKNKLALLTILAVITGFMGWHASKVQLSYDFTAAIPTNNARFADYQNFRKQFGEDGNMMVIGLQSDHLFDEKTFSDFASLGQQIKKINGVENILSVPVAVTLVKDSVAGLKAQNIYNFTIPSASSTAVSIRHFDSSKHLFFGLPFYKNLLYNPQTNATLMAVRINKDILVTKERTVVINAIVSLANQFGKDHSIDMHYSGLPLIRTQLADRMKKEMKWFLAGSVLLSAIILLIFFRSISTMLLSLAVVLTGVIWSVGTLHLFAC
jgi:predicted RND superfamily exporter protein